jgi:hypothetical protein
MATAAIVSARSERVMEDIVSAGRLGESKRSS